MCRCALLLALISPVLAIAVSTAGSGSNEVNSEATAVLAERIKVSERMHAAKARGERATFLVVHKGTSRAAKALGTASLGGSTTNEQIESDDQQRLQMEAIAAQKSRAFSSTPPENARLERDFSQLPISLVSFRDQAAIDQLQSRDDIEGIYLPEVKRTRLARSLPLIGQPTASAAGHMGAGTAVAVIDSGIVLTDPAFGNCTAVATPESCRIVESRSFLTNGKPATDVSHGTNVAGIVAGVAPETKILALSVFNDAGDATDPDIIAALDFVMTNRSKYNIVAINLSLGGDTKFQFVTNSGPFAAAFARLRAVGILPVVAAGNERYTDGLSNPANVLGAVSVGAVYSGAFGRVAWSSCTDTVTFADRVTCFSNSASFLTLLAPGALITAAGIQLGGTSQASPHVAGAVAVLRRAFPNESLTQTVARLRAGPKVTDVRNSLESPRLSLTAALAASPTVQPVLNVGLQGLGSGKVTSADGKIDCVSKCTLEAAAGTRVVLSAVAASGSSFVGFSGAGCAGANTCTVTLNELNPAPLVYATFNKTGGVAPGNDNFANASVADLGTVTSSNANATREAGEPLHVGNGGGRSLWWRWVPGFTGTAAIDTKGTNIDTILGVYTGTQLDALIELASNDDVPGGVVNVDLYSRVEISVTAGQVLYIAVDGFDGAAGTIPLTITKVSETVRVVSATLNSSANPSTFDQTITLNASFIGVGSVSGTTAKFTEIQDSTSTVLCERVAVVTVNNIGQASCTVPASARGVGTHAYRVDYAEPSSLVTANASLRQIVSETNPVLAITSTPVRPTAGQPITLTAQVNDFGGSGLGGLRFRERIGANDVDIPACIDVQLSPLPTVAGAARNAAASCVVPMVTEGSHEYVMAYTMPRSGAVLTKALTVAVATSGPLDYSDLWWAGEAENGWGMTIMQRGAIQFNAFYVYDDNGNPIWYVMPNGAWNADFTKYTGELYATKGTPLLNYDATALQVLPTIGSATLHFTSATTATLDYLISGKTGRKTLSRQVFGVPDEAPRLSVRDLWWGGRSENGWGISIAQQERTVFAVWFTYDSKGTPTWYVLPGGTWSDNTFTGTLYTTRGATWVGANYDANRLIASPVGSMSLQFIDLHNTQMTYTVNGVTQTKGLVRQPF